jgi:scyllo-inositol 2-dehydrogenase (NAD+)
MGSCLSANDRALYWMQAEALVPPWTNADLSVPGQATRDAWHVLPARACFLHLPESVDRRVYHEEEPNRFGFWAQGENMSKLGVAVVGVGVLGKRHAENLCCAIPGARLVAVADSDSSRASQVASQLEIEDFYPGMEDLVKREDIQAVVIATPAKYHAEGIEMAAKAGKHVFCEKPMALTLADADAVLAAANKAGIQLQIGFMRRYDPAYASARKRIEAGEIGDPVIFKSVGRDKEPPPPSFLQSGVNGTLFSDAAIHDFDLVRWLMDDEVAAVHSFAGLVACPELAEFNDIDACLVNLRLERGGIGNVEAFRKASYGYDIRTEVLGTQGALQIGYLQQTAHLVLTGTGIAYDVVDHWLSRFADAYLNELRAFVGSIAADRPVWPAGEDGRRALAVALAAEQSYRESRPIALTVAAPSPSSAKA